MERFQWQAGYVLKVEYLEMYINKLKAEGLDASEWKSRRHVYIGLDASEGESHRHVSNFLCIPLRHGILAGRGRRPRLIYINRITPLFVSLSVSLSVSYLLLENLWCVDLLYMDRREIYQGRFITKFQVRPGIILDVICRKPDTGRKKRSKNAVFSPFFVK